MLTKDGHMSLNQLLQLYLPPAVRPSLMTELLSPRERIAFALNARNKK